MNSGDIAGAKIPSLRFAKLPKLEARTCVAAPDQERVLAATATDPGGWT